MNTPAANATTPQNTVATTKRRTTASSYATGADGDAAAMVAAVMKRLPFPSRQTLHGAPSARRHDHQVAIGVPGGVPDQRQGQPQADIERRHPGGGEQHDQRRPADHH